MSDWPTAVGSVSGGAVVGVLALVGERLRARARRRERWLDLRRELAVRFLDAIEEIHRWATQGTNLMVSETTGSPTVTIEGVSSWMDASAKLGAADASVRALAVEIGLVGSREERSAARRLREAVWTATSAYARTFDDVDDEKRKENVGQRDETLQEYMAARESFEEIVRQGLTGEG